ncbi:CopY/TcrY family copper transport repressor [Streptococcus sp. zg-JUN1979]|uniref:CopY/TcrY family copper transport repressor n=1 Tax=Streptococcus sp. zg-JUN1979 TaxID=3391450 RepID=UPI0039A434FE
MGISNAEWDVMRVVWVREEATSNLIFMILSSQRQWSLSTIKTLLKRLVDKGYLRTKRQGKGYVYSALISEDEAMNVQIDAHFAKYCAQKHPFILGHLLEKTDMTKADILALQTILAQKKEVDVILCDCIPGQCQCKEHLEGDAKHE